MRVVFSRRFVCAVLLLLAGHIATAADPPPNQFEADIRTFEEADRRSPPPAGTILFVGSSSIRFWDLKKSFPELDTTNRGFGGAHLSDCVHFFDRVVAKYRPRVVVLYAGDNDVASGKTAAQIADDCRTVAERVRQSLPDARLIFISIKPSPLRWTLADEQRKANALIEAYAREQKHITYVDLFGVMLGPDGTPRAELFVGDRLHLSDKGYALWSSVLRPHLAAASLQRATGDNTSEALAPVDDAPGLPRVLIIGDSISIDYTLPTRRRLAGVANVHRIPTNGGPTTNGLANLDAWLGDLKWDVIHFNWGLHDLRRKDELPQVSLEQYERNLETLVSRLQRTGAKLIWATTTPVPEGAANRAAGDEVKYNAAAQRVFRRHGVQVDDLHKFALPRLEQIQRPSNVHFTHEGSELLAGQVAEAIRGSLRLARERPNVILIVADDFGFECVGANGGTSYRTPNLDKLASRGVRFGHCYVQPLCTPTRVQLMTGAYNVRNYITFGMMDARLTTFANLFRDAGYATCIAGKWQLGRDAALPRKFGFDESCLWQHLRRPPRYANPGLEINAVQKDFHDGQYGPDIVHRYAEDFIERHRDRPFFLYYTLMLTHAPYQPTPDSPDWDPRAHGERVNQAPQHFGDMVAYMDKLVGRLVAKLDELKLSHNTLVIFTGDNGTGRGTRSMMGDREVVGGKGSTTAAGMHVPLIASWQGTAASGKVCEDLVDSTDFLPTICEAAGVTVPAELTIDGRSFLPQIRGEAGQPRRWTYSWYSPRGEPPRELAFNHRYKLYRSGEFHDLESDTLEKHPLDVDSLTDGAAAAARELQEALDEFRNARPAQLRDDSSH